jgi:DNA invertase Pin-like site-specific DNA recombinase
MKRVHVGIYVRSSVPDHTATQLQELRAFAETCGWKATHYIDDGLSGVTGRRPALEAMVAAARKRKIQVILCTGLDRLHRSVEALAALIAELVALHVNVVVVDVDATTVYRHRALELATDRLRIRIL